MDSLTSGFMNQSLDDFMDGVGSGFGSRSMFSGNGTGSRRLFDSERGRSMSSSYDSEGFGSSGFSGFPGMPGDDRTQESRYDSERTSAYSGFPGMPGDDRTGGSRHRTRSPESYRPSAYSGFPGMPGDDRTGGSRNRTQSPDSYESDPSGPFNMRRTDTSSSSSRRRSPSPRSRARGFRTTSRRPEPSSTFDSRGYGTDTFSSRGYAPDTTFDSTSTARPGRRSPSPKPRRRRSPSPVRRRQRSPSPPRRGAAHGRSQPKPEPASRNQYNGVPPRGYSHSTSHNQYNGTPPKPKAAPKPTGWSRPKPSSEKRSQSHSSSSRARSNSSSSAQPSRAANPAPSRSELKRLFDAYNAKWYALSRTDKNYPLPTSSRELSKLDFHGGSTTNLGNWSNEEIFIANVQILFLAGFGMSGTIKRYNDALEVKIDNPAVNGANIQLLSKWLSRKEQPRWHPDRMNLRTGREGKLDDKISGKPDVVAMRTAVQRLLATVNA